jgi:DNA-binding beta-propeller fold protein YncE
MFLIALSCSAVQFIFAQSTLPVVIDTIAVGGSGGIDYITCDPKTHRLYISHSTRVEVVQYDTKEHVGSIEKTSGVHGIALASELSRGFTSNGKDGSVTVFDTKTLAVVKIIDTKEKKPDAILYEPQTKRVFVFNGDSENCTAIDATTMNIVGTLALGGGPEAPVADRKGDIFVNIETTNEVVRFNAASLKISSRWAVAPAQTPTGISMDRANRILFIGGRNQVFVAMNADDGKIFANFPIGKGVDGTAFDSKTGMIYVSNKDGSLDMFEEDSLKSFELVGKVLTSPGAKTLTLDPVSHKVFLPCARSVDGPGGLKGEMIVLVVGVR